MGLSTIAAWLGESLRRVFGLLARRQDDVGVSRVSVNEEFAMAKIATVRFGWTRSASADVTRVEVVVTIDGVTTTAEYGPEVEEHMVDIKAMSSGSFKVVSYDDENNLSSSQTYTFVLSDLEAPQPATGLNHVIVSIRDES